MKSADILSLCKSDPNSIVDHIKSLDSQIKELNEKLKFLEARLNQNSQNSSKPPFTAAIPVLNKNTYNRRLKIIIVCNHFGRPALYDWCFEALKC